MSTHRIPDVDLHDGVTIPQLGFGVFQVPPGETYNAVTRALDAGYRHIDTAAAYGNEAEVGQAVLGSGLDRGEVFVTTKLANPDHGHEQAHRAFKASLERLELRGEGVVRAIGVSYFQPAHLRRVIDETGVAPAINQVELHPRLQQPGLRREHEELGIVTEAWSPLAKGGVLDDPVIGGLAEAHGKTPAQIVLRWHLQLGNVVIPKSVTPARIAENVDVFDFHLSGREMDAIEQLDAGERTGPDPDRFG